MPGVPEPMATVVVTVWRHGAEVVGRVRLAGTTPQQGDAGRACRSVDEVCAAVRDLVEEAVRV
ncbi:MAG: hypothetical protein QOK43_3202 [Acidimicrobiaceae bacterium]|nr:hypothetical protein [Acidimicrobiaceae bacterium]